MPKPSAPGEDQPRKVSRLRALLFGTAGLAAAGAASAAEAPVSADVGAKGLPPLEMSAPAPAPELRAPSGERIVVNTLAPAAVAAEATPAAQLVTPEAAYAPNVAAVYEPHALMPGAQVQEAAPAATPAKLAPPAEARPLDSGPDVTY